MAPAEAVTRPRVEGERELEILEATLDVLAEVGYDRLTMDAVATAAKASKATLYRRWESKARLVLDALLSHKEPLGDLPDTGTLRGDLLAEHCGHGGLGDAKQMAVFSAVITAVARDAEFAEAFRRDFIGPRFERNLAIYQRAIDRGELRDDLDLAIVGPALPGIVLHRQFLMGEMPTPESITQVIDQIILPAVLSHPADPAKDPS